MTRGTVGPSPAATAVEEPPSPVAIRPSSSCGSPRSSRWPRGADCARLGDEVAELSTTGADRRRWDIMDGQFGPNVTFGADVARTCRACADVPFVAPTIIARETEISEARDLADRADHSVRVEVDGGISVGTAESARKAGAEFRRDLADPAFAV